MLNAYEIPEVCENPANKSRKLRLAALCRLYVLVVNLPEKVLDMARWVTPIPECGTASCIYGWWCRTGISKAKLKDENRVVDVDARIEDAAYAHPKLTTGHMGFAAAVREFGLTHTQSIALFESGELTPEQAERVFQVMFSMLPVVCDIGQSGWHGLRRSIHANTPSSDFPGTVRQAEAIKATIARANQIAIAMNPPKRTRKRK